MTNSGWILANGGDVRLVGTLANTGAFTARAQSTIEFACPQVSVDLSVLNIDPGGGVILSGECQMGSLPAI